MCPYIPGSGKRFGAYAITEHSTLQTYPDATIEAHGNGTGVLVSDPSIIVNGMFDAPDNRAFLDARTTDANTVAYDLSHAAHVPPRQCLLVAIRGSRSSRPC